MALNLTFYGTVLEAQSYFECKLRADAWLDAKPSERKAALVQAASIIDTLAFKGCKAAVYALGDSATAEAKRAADLTQPLEFPRDTDADVPENIRKAAYEIAYALLDGVDPEMELEALGISSQGLESVRTTYARNQVPIEHIVNGVPSAQAWRWLVPFLRDGTVLRISRV